MKKLLLPLLLGSLLGASTAHAENLIQVYELALQNDPQLKAALATRNAALEAKPQAESRFLPSINLSSGANMIRSDVNHSASGASLNHYGTGSLALNLSQSVYRKEYGIQLDQADKQIAQAEVAYAAEEQDLILRVAQAYFNVLSAQDMLEFAKAENAAIARQLEQSKQRFEVGLIAITDVHEAQAAFDQSRADLIQAENVLDNAWEAQQEIIMQGVDQLDPLAADLPLNPPEPQNPEQWAETAQIQNLALQAAQFGVAIARMNIDLQDSGDSPTVDLVGSHALNLSSSASGTDSQTTTVGLQLNVPLYTGGAVNSRTRQARFDYEATQQNMDKQRRSVNRMVRDAYRGVMSSISTVEALKASTISAQSALEATEAGFEVGTRTMVDVLNSQRDLFRARSNYSKVRYDFILSGLQLKQATGTLTKEDLMQVNSWLK
ncbi:MAG: TolC family outer membrane protein [Sedimenticola sp.]|uniref:TolC family outer membrane protein n=1 Tax=Sedimenticola thiotaurini TaxID=1543721 RepID=A0A558D2C0_9GAMM|nr:TolC family outer membrane protein [Sedimenticola sp.]MCW8976357.1 TolC family outer membrane protein [Sedimenticola sp.]TVT55146.1 MAG: TolC family outer membrane protein [Sedimenticola thiotaurini]